MIVLNVTYQCKPGTREEFMEMIVTDGIDIASRAEEGNIKYDYYMSVENEDELLLLEKWADSAASASHITQPHYAKLGELKKEYVIDVISERFDA